jgi:hypothetical protein
MIQKAQRVIVAERPVAIPFFIPLNLASIVLAEQGGTGLNQIPEGMIAH